MVLRLRLLWPVLFVGSALSLIQFTFPVLAWLGIRVNFHGAFGMIALLCALLGSLAALMSHVWLLAALIQGVHSRWSELGGRIALLTVGVALCDTYLAYGLDDNLTQISYTNAVIATPTVSATYDPLCGVVSTSARAASFGA